MLQGLIPAYLHHLPEITAASNDRSNMFCGHLASFAVFGTIDPLGHGWLGELLTRTAHRERLHWATNVTQMLREADEQVKESAWERWMQQYREAGAAQAEFSDSAPHNGDTGAEHGFGEGHSGAPAACEGRHNGQRVHAGVAGERKEDGR
jgi:hypothetical protein